MQHFKHRDSVTYELVAVHNLQAIDLEYEADERWES